MVLLILVYKTKMAIESVTNAFKKYNESWSKNLVIMSEKNFNDAFSSCFLSTQLFICLYQTLRSLRREVIVKKWELLLQNQLTL